MPKPSIPLQLEHEFTELKLDDHTEKVGDRETNVVLGLAKGQPPVKLYFDKDSGLLLRMVHYADTPLGFNPTQVDFADYREVGGVEDAISLDDCPPQWQLHHQDR